MKTIIYQPIDLDTPFNEELEVSVSEAMRNLYRKQGYVKPWIGYFAKNEKNVTLGVCSFKSPPKNGKVEIAYYTFPNFERQGIATLMAKHLVHVATEVDKNISILAQTLPENNASTSILKKLGFRMIGVKNHTEDGNVWEWVLDKIKS